MKGLSIFILTIASIAAASLDALEVPSFPSGRIVNGHEAQRGEAPFIVSLSHFGEHYCAGVIIDRNWILTAAHCLMYDYINVYAGLHSWRNVSEGQYRFIGGKKYQIIHKKYEDGVGPYDIGLIYVNTPFELNTPLSRNGYGDGDGLVGLIGLASGKYSVNGKGRLYGWGREKFDRKPEFLQTLDVDVIDYGPCKAALPADAKIHETNICSYTEGEYDGACNGDSGGPLVKLYPNEQPELIGIVSWGYSPCDATKYPSVYTWVEPHKQWINEKIAGYSV